jgi:hypothetical protein
MNFSHGDKVRELQPRVSALMEWFVYPAESRFQDKVAKNRSGANPDRVQTGTLGPCGERSA